MYQKVTITLPVWLVEMLNKNVKKGEKSSFVSKAIHEKLVDEKLRKRVKDPVKAFHELRNITPKLSHDEILDSIERGRK